ncbi:hypothetical protein D3C76_1419460 [compost metagenome]
MQLGHGHSQRFGENQVPDQLVIAVTADNSLFRPFVGDAPQLREHIEDQKQKEGADKQVGGIHQLVLHRNFADGPVFAPFEYRLHG